MMLKNQKLLLKSNYFKTLKTPHPSFLKAKIFVLLFKWTLNGYKQSVASNMKNKIDIKEVRIIDKGEVVVLDGQEMLKCGLCAAPLGRDIAFSFLAVQGGSILQGGIAYSPTQEQIKILFYNLFSTAQDITSVNVHLVGGNGFEASRTSEKRILSTLTEINNEHPVMNITTNCMDAHPDYCTLGRLLVQHMTSYDQ